MFKKLFGKNKQHEEVENNVVEEVAIILKAPMTGKVLDVSETPDEAFAQKMLGDGVAIEPTEGVVYSPADGEIVQLFPTKHAVGILSNDGLELLIHIGMDTVNMKGEGFEALVQQGDKVVAGQELIRFDLEKVKKEAKSTITPVLITNMYDIKSHKVLAEGNVVAKEDILSVEK